MNVPLIAALVLSFIVARQTELPAAAAPAGNVSEAKSVLRALQLSLEGLYAEVNPSVVNIRVLHQADPGEPEGPFPHFPFIRPPEPQDPGEFQRQGLGSGFVWDASGHIVSNHHVVADAAEILVTLHDGAIVPARLIGADPDSDLAVIKVDPRGLSLQPARLGDSTLLKVGQLAVAIGNPFGLTSTMTVGFISALGRLLPVDSGIRGGSNYTIPDIIQTDASINPGSSGGVLVNDEGSVIGVTTAILSPVGASVGIGFAVPSVIVDKVIPALITEGRYIHPWIGLGGVELSPDLARAMGLDPGQRGALIVDVVADGPADRAGLRGSGRQAKIRGENVRVGGDVIIEVNGKPVRDFDDLVEYLARSGKVGQEVQLKFLRDGEEQTATATLASRPGSAGRTQPAPSTSKTGRPWLGVTGLNMNPEIARAMSLPADQRGVLVEQVMKDSPADKANIRGSYKPMSLRGEEVLIGGDVIVGIDGRPVNSMEELLNAIAAFRVGDTIAVDLLRDGNMQRVVLTLAEMPSKP